MADFKFIHAADIHLGRPFSGMEKSHPELGKRFRKAGYIAWERIIQAALDHKADFVTLAGDVFDSSNPSVRTRVAFRDGVLKLHDAGIPVFMALGNHDSLAVFPEALRSLPGLHVFGPEPEGVRPNLRGNADGVVIFGASFEMPVVKHNLVSTFSRDPGIDTAIGLVHANVSAVGGHMDYAPCTLDDLKASGMDVWCLGHVHAGVVLCQEPLILYPGAAQGAHINESGPRGYYLVSVLSGNAASAEFFPVAPVAWAKVDVDVSGCASLEDIMDEVEIACQDSVGDEPASEALVVRVHLTGSGYGIWAGVSAGIQEMIEVLGERLSNQRIPVFPESVRDLTIPPVNPELLIREEGFLADFLKMCRGFSQDEAEREDILGTAGAELLKKVSRTYLAQALDPQRLTKDPKYGNELLREAENLVTGMFLEPSRS